MIFWKIGRDGFFMNYEPENWTLTTEEEVETALVNEAVKRGFELGKKVKWNFNGSEEV